MRSPSFDQLCNLAVGDEFVEEGWDTIECVVTSAPVVKVADLFDKMRRQVSWIACVTSGRREGETINYLVTEGLEHYGPTLYV